MSGLRIYGVACTRAVRALWIAEELDLAPWPHLKRWLKRCLDRAAARKTLALKAESDEEMPAHISCQSACINRL